ncbi:hypothetical protein NEDG_01250 [Nematocida displodere]|uniref:Uncharacterized protein n=1 Tax=Nematocida displodere TaxID=1805483 RepID=A0A177EC73_9MICR|nr:hypothetical protein NEDG_01250 [Nematocida displodere]
MPHKTNLLVATSAAGALLLGGVALFFLHHAKKSPEQNNTSVLDARPEPGPKHNHPFPLSAESKPQINPNTDPGPGIPLAAEPQLLASRTLPATDGATFQAPSIPAMPTDAQSPKHHFPPEPEHASRSMASPSQPHTRLDTAALFVQHGSGLDMACIGQSPQIKEKQTGDTHLYLKNLAPEDIPEQIDPALCFEWLSVHGSVHRSVHGSAFPGTPYFTAPKEVAALAKLLHALSGSTIKTLSIDGVHIQDGAAPTAAGRIALSIAKTLCITNASSAFLEWFCASVDLSSCSEELAIDLYSCETKSIRCLDSLGVRGLSKLFLINLPNLEHLDCQLAGPASSSGVLRLWNLPKLQEAPPGLDYPLAGKWQG